MTRKNLIRLVTSFALLGAVTSNTAACGTPSSTRCEPSVAPGNVAPPEGRTLRRPVLRLSEHGDWGSPTQHAGIPTFTLYEDGLVVYADGTGESAKAMQARLSEQEVYALVEMANDKIGELPPRVRVSQATDQAEATIGVVYHGRIYSVGVYGVGQSGTPEVFSELQKLLQEYKHPQAEPWQPDELEVVVYRKDDLRRTAKTWPAELPQPPQDAREPRPLRAGRSKTAYQQPIRYRVDGELEARLAEVLPPAGDMQAFRWRDTAWLVRTERVVPARTFFW